MHAEPTRCEAGADLDQRPNCYDSRRWKLPMHLRDRWSEEPRLGFVYSKCIDAREVCALSSTGLSQSARQFSRGFHHAAAHRSQLSFALGRLESRAGSAIATAGVSRRARRAVCAMSRVRLLFALVVLLGITTGGRALAQTVPIAIPTAPVASLDTRQEGLFISAPIVLDGAVLFRIAAPTTPRPGRSRSSCAFRSGSAK
jgi:hypothetical protein